MKTFFLNKLTAREYASLLLRPSCSFDDILPSVQAILNEVQRSGDEALRRYTNAFDGVKLSSVKIRSDELNDARKVVPDNVTAALRAASRNIRAFHEAQPVKSSEVTTARGVVCRREWRPISPVGLYIPGGSAPLVSTVLMLGIPATLAGCSEIVLCTPPGKNGEVAPAILAAAQELGITMVFKVGGAQAIAAMGFGTKTVPRVAKIFGPGNRYVSAAKMLISQPPANTAIDMLAGPTELMIVADEKSNPHWIAADLISQAEHGEDSQVALVTTSRKLVGRVQESIALELESLPRREIAERSLDASFSLVVNSISDAIEFSNRYAPEHLILAVEGAENLRKRICNAGSVFLGPMSSVVFGDYAAGPNHTLPTGGWARSVGGITVESFMKPLFFQTISANGVHSLAPTVRELARTEFLEGHAYAAAVREHSL